jgi:hypothetical protein
MTRSLFLLVVQYRQSVPGNGGILGIRQNLECASYKLAVWSCDPNPNLPPLAGSVPVNAAGSAQLGGHIWRILTNFTFRSVSEGNAQPLVQCARNFPSPPNRNV